MKSPLAALFEDSMDVPDEAKKFFVEGTDARIKITITNKTFKKAQDIVNVLVPLRDITPEAQIGPTHPHVLMVIAQEGNVRPVEEVIREVRYIHGQWFELAQSDGAKIALTEMTRLRMDVEPEPYEPEELELEFDNDWEKPRAQIPAIPRNLANMYEKRLKLLNDMINAGGFVFSIQVTNRINNSFAKLMGEQAGKTDKAGFPS